MVDKKYCMSSYLSLRYVERENTHFTERFPYNRPKIEKRMGYDTVKTAKEIGEAIERQISEIRGKSQKIGIMLSGGMDSAIVASYLDSNDQAYTFRFRGGMFQKEELQRAEQFAEYNQLDLHYVDINWDSIVDVLPIVMKAKGGPVHSIEPQIYLAAKQAQANGVDLMLIGDGADYIFGGMDGLLSKDWKLLEFMERYIYVNPADVLKEPESMLYLFERYKKGADGIDFEKFLSEVATEESYGSYSNAFNAAALAYYDPYERLYMSESLDLARIRNGESKYLIRELFRIRYLKFDIPEKNPMPRPVDEYFTNWNGPVRDEFKELDIDKYSGNQLWLIWCLEKFLDMIDS